MFHFLNWKTGDKESKAELGCSLGHTYGAPLIAGSTLKVWEEMGTILANCRDNDSDPVYFLPFRTSTQVLLSVAPLTGKLLSGGMTRSPPPLCLLSVLAGHLCNHILITKVRSGMSVIGGISIQNRCSLVAIYKL